MRTNLHKLPVALLALTAAASMLTAASAESDWDKKARERKADYIFLEAQDAYSQEEFDKYIALVEQAYALNPSDVDIAGEWALLNLLDNEIDSASAESSYALLKKRYYANPKNMINGSILANVAQKQKRYADAVKVWETLDSIYPTKSEPAMQLAQAYLRNYLTGDSASFDKAMAIYDRIQTGTGRTIELSNQKINAYLIKGDTVAVTAELDSLYASAPDDSRTAFFLGAHYQYLNNPEKTIQFYDLSCKLDSTNGPAYLSRAQFYNAQGDSVAFDREVFHALKSQNLDFDSKLEMLRNYVSSLYKDRRQEPRIRELFNTLQQQHAGEPQVHGMYGAYLYELKDYKGAAEQFSYAYDLDPTDESALMSYIQTSGLAEDTVAVEKATTEAMHRFPANLYFPIVASNMLRLQGNNHRAMAVLDSVDISSINNPTAVSNFLTSKGDLFSVIGDTIKAIETYDKAIELDPNNSMALNNAAYFLSLLGTDLDKAERYSARSLKGDDLNPTYLDTYAWVFYKKKEYNMAKIYIDIAIRSHESEANESDTPDESLPTGDGSDDDELIETSVEEEEENNASGLSADIYDHAGDIYFMNGEQEEAVKFWEKAHELDPSDQIIEQKVKLRTIIVR